MKRASFLCLFAVSASAAQPGLPPHDTVETPWTGTSAGDFVMELETARAADAITATECRVYAHIRDNFVSKLEMRRMKGRCNFDELRHREA